MDAVELASAQESGQQIVIVQFILSLLLSQVLAMVFGSILVVQIIAHLPLTDINLPVNVLQPFQIMISVVSFDYFPPFEYIDAGFSDVWAYSPNFEWIGYDSINFLQGLGSIAFFACIQLLTVLLALMCVRCRQRLPSKKLRESLSGATVWGTSLAFIHGTFFEILVCLAVNEQMLEYYEHWNEPDHFSMYVAIFFGLLLLSYLGFGVYFVCFKSEALAQLNRIEEDKRNLERCEELHQKLAEDQGKKSSYTAMQSEQVDEILKRRQI